MDEMGELLISKLRAKVKAGEKSIDMYVSVSPKEASQMNWSVGILRSTS